MKQSKYWYGGVHSVIKVMPTGQLLIANPRSSMLPEQAREFAVALLEAANDADLGNMEIIGTAPPVPEDGECEDCEGKYQFEDDPDLRRQDLTLYQGLSGTFWACDHCYDVRTMEE